MLTTVIISIYICLEIIFSLLYEQHALSRSAVTAAAITSATAQRSTADQMQFAELSRILGKRREREEEKRRGGKRRGGREWRHKEARRGEGEGGKREEGKRREGEGEREEREGRERGRKERERKGRRGWERGRGNNILYWILFHFNPWYLFQSLDSLLFILFLTLTLLYHMISFALSAGREDQLQGMYRECERHKEEKER